MKIHHLVVRGRIPSKKNNRVNTKSGRSFPSAKYREWEYVAMVQLRGYNHLRIEKVTRIQLEFAWPDNRKADLTNKAESVMDMLVKIGILKDDNWKVVPELHLKSLGVNKEDPGVEIWIEHDDKSITN